MHRYLLKLHMSTARRRLKSTQSLSGTSSQATMVTQKSISWSWMDESHPFRSMLTGHTIPEKRLFQTLTFEFEGHGDGCGQRAMSYGRPNILLILFAFISQSNQQFMRHSYFEIEPLTIQDQGHTWGQRSMLHVIPSIQPMHLLFVLHQSHQPFLRYVRKSVWPSKTLPNFKKKVSQKLCDRMSPKSYQVISMTWGIHWASFVVIEGGFYRADKQIFVNQCHSRDFGTVHFPKFICFCPKYVRFDTNGFDVRGKSLCCGGRGGGRGGNKLKTYKSPLTGWPNYCWPPVIQQWEHVCHQTTRVSCQKGPVCHA